MPQNPNWNFCRSQICNKICSEIACSNRSGYLQSAITGYIGTRTNLDAQQKATLSSLNSYYCWQNPAFPFLVHPPSGLLQYCDVLIDPQSKRYPCFTQAVKLKYRDKVLQVPKDNRTPNITQTALITDASSQRDLLTLRTAGHKSCHHLPLSTVHQEAPLKAATLHRFLNIFWTTQQRVYSTQSHRELASYLCLISPEEKQYVSKCTPGTSAAWNAFYTSVWGMKA